MFNLMRRLWWVLRGSVERGVVRELELHDIEGLGERHVDDLRSSVDRVRTAAGRLVGARTKLEEQLSGLYEQRSRCERRITVAARRGERDTGVLLAKELFGLNERISNLESQVEASSLRVEGAKTDLNSLEMRVHEADASIIEMCARREAAVAARTLQAQVDGTGSRATGQAWQQACDSILLLEAEAQLQAELDGSSLKGRLRDLDDAEEWERAEAFFAAQQREADGVIALSAKR